MKILISQLSLGKRNFKQKLERLKKHVESQEIDILDNIESDIYSVRIPVYLRGRGVEMSIKCQLKLTNNIRHSYLNIYANITKPLIVTVLIGTILGAVAFLIYNSITASLFLLITGVIISLMLIFIPLKRQIHRKVHDWLKKDP